MMMMMMMMMNYRTAMLNYWQTMKWNHITTEARGNSFAAHMQQMAIYHQIFASFSTQGTGDRATGGVPL